MGQSFRQIHRADSTQQLHIRGKNSHCPECQLRCRHCAQHALGQFGTDARKKSQRHQYTIGFYQLDERGEFEASLRQRELFCDY